MKKTNVFTTAAICAMLFFTNYANAQWALTGNATTAPNNVLGTTNATDLNIRTNGLTRMFVKASNGFIGIGTVTPGYLLDIQNSGNASMNFKSATGNANILIERGTSANSASVNYRTGGAASWQTGNLNDNNFTINNVGASPSITVLKTNNNVGIGTTNPSSKLDVNGTARVQSLALSGGGTRPVFADANGVLVAQTQSQLGSFSGSSATMNGLAWPCDTLKTSITVSGLPASVNSAGIKVTLTISKNHVGSFRTFLRAPNGQRIGLILGSNLADHFNTLTQLTNTVITDGGGSLSSGTEPYTGTFAPAGSISPSCLASASLVSTFSQLGGGTVNPNGNWTLEMESNWGGSLDAGNVTSWSIAFIDGVQAGGTNNYFPKWNNGSLTETSNIYDDGTNIGIGTTTPGSPLTVVSPFASTPVVKLLPRAAGGTYRVNFGIDDWSLLQDYFGTGVSKDFSIYQNSKGAHRMLIDTLGNVGIGTTTPANRLTVYNGTTTGNYTTTGWIHSSDARLKTNVKALEGALAKIVKLEGVSYNWKSNPGGNNQIGFIAQDVEKIFPEVIVKDEKGNYGMAPQNLTAPIIEAIKEQQKQLDDKNQIINSLQSTVGNLQNQLNEMQQCVESLCNSSSLKTSSSSTAVETKLMQNQPNPFNATTVIRYELAADAGNGKIIIRDLNGNLVKQIIISQTGKGQAVVNANELVQGTYTYTLEIAGQSVDTKLMVITK